MDEDFCVECGSETEAVLEKEVEPGVIEIHDFCPGCHEVSVYHYFEADDRLTRTTKPVIDIEITVENRGFIEDMFADDEQQIIPIQERG